MRDAAPFARDVIAARETADALGRLRRRDPRDEYARARPGEAPGHVAVGRGRAPVERRIDRARARAGAIAMAVVPPVQLPAQARGNAVDARGLERAVSGDARLKAEHGPACRSSRAACERAARNKQNAGRERKRGGDRDRLFGVHFSSLTTGDGRERTDEKIASGTPSSVVRRLSSVSFIFHSPCRLGAGVSRRSDRYRATVRRPWLISLLEPSPRAHVAPQEPWRRA